jgi:hypothetical protein
MTLLNVSFAKLHDDLFFGGKSFGKRLEPLNNGGLKMVYDTEEKELLVTWGDKTTHVPSTNIASYSVGAVEDRKLVQMGSPMISGIGKAQVETPMGHVQAGPGYGKTGNVKL